VTSDPCPSCGKTGHIRGDHLIKADRRITEWHCVACAHTWREVDDGHPQPDRPENP